MKNKIDLISKDLEVCLNKNKSLKNDLDTHVYHASVDSPSSSPIACPSSSKIENEIKLLKKNIDCLGSTMSQCALNHTRLESLFQKKQVPSLHAHHPQHTHASHAHAHHTLYAHVYTCTPWFKVSVSAADLAGTETDRSRRLGSDLDDTRKTLHRTPKKL